jgi:hypothetical protein
MNFLCVRSNRADVLLVRVFESELFVFPVILIGALSEEEANTYILYASPSYFRSVYSAVLGTSEHEFCQDSIQSTVRTCIKERDWKTNTGV